MAACSDVRMLGCPCFSGLFFTGEIRLCSLPRCDRGKLRAKGSDDQERGLHRIALRSWPLRSNFVLHEVSVPGSIYSGPGISPMCRSCDRSLRALYAMS